jgi:hypothetical protein
MVCINTDRSKDEAGQLQLEIQEILPGEKDPLGRVACFQFCI